MPIPTYRQMMLPMLRLIGEGHAQMKDCMPHLMTEFAVSKEEAEVLLPSGKQTMMSNRAHWARRTSVVRSVDEDYFIEADGG